MLRLLARALIVAGLAGIVLGAYAGAQLRRGLPFGAPLAAPSGLAVDAAGRLFAGTGADRVHAYGPDGHFLRGWWLDRDAGRLRLRVDDEGRVEVATERSGRLHLFDRDGALLETHPDPGAFARFGPTQDRVVEGADGARYELEDGALVRTAPPPRTLIAPPVRAPLAWFPRTPLPVLTVILTASTTGLLAGAVLASRARHGSPSRPR